MHVFLEKTHINQVCRDLDSKLLTYSTKYKIRRTVQCLPLYMLHGMLWIFFFLVSFTFLPTFVMINWGQNIFTCPHWLWAWPCDLTRPMECEGHTVQNIQLEALNMLALLPCIVRGVCPSLVLHPESWNQRHQPKVLTRVTTANPKIYEQETNVRCWKFLRFFALLVMDNMQQ